MPLDAGLRLVDWPASAWAVVGLGYLAGSIPFGLLVGRLVAGVDPRRVGSGNIGATNVGRHIGRRWGIAVGLLDGLKGLVPVLLVAGPLFAGHDQRPAIEVATALAAVAGHCWSLFLALHGGKGVATACGVMLALDPRVFLAGGLAWILVVATTRFVGLASIVMALVFALVSWLLRAGEVLPFGCAFLAAIVLLRHRANIARMLAGTEPKLGSPRLGDEGR